MVNEDSKANRDLMVNKDSIRKITTADFPSILALTAGLPQSAGFSWQKEKLLSELQSAEGYVSVGESVSAFVLFRTAAPTADITVLATRPAVLKKGKMFQLLNQVFELEQGIARWLIEVHPGNGGALALYKKLGFKKISERKNYYSDGQACWLLEYLHK